MKIYFATGNKGKLLEVREKFAALGIVVEQLVHEYPEIQSDSLESVVEWGLSWLWEKHAKPVMIDDSGLFVDALEGFPGVFSAYAFGSLGCDGIIKLLADANDRAAEFRCCAGFVDEDGSKIVVTGQVRGRIIQEPRGSGGFGYDPIFVPEGHERTFAEMSVGEKNSVSHRGRAFEQLADALKRLKD